MLKTNVDKIQMSMPRCITQSIIELKIPNSVMITLQWTPPRRIINIHSFCWMGLMLGLQSLRQTSIPPSKVACIFNTFYHIQGSRETTVQHSGPLTTRGAEITFALTGVSAPLVKRLSGLGNSNKRNAQLQFVAGSQISHKAFVPRADQQFNPWPVALRNKG